MDLKTVMLGSDTVVVTENADGDPYLIQAKYLQGVVDDWNGECNFVPANDAKVLFAMYNGHPIKPYDYTDFSAQDSNSGGVSLNGRLARHSA